MRAAWAGLVLLAGATVWGPAWGADVKDPELRLVIARSDGTHAAAKLPLSDADRRDAKNIWAWTERLPPRKLDISTVPLDREHILDELARPKARSLEIRVRGWSRPEELAFVQVIAAPQEMWASVPEPLLPVFLVSKEGHAIIAVRDPIRLRVIGKGTGTVWEQVSRTTRSVDVLLRRPASNASLSFQSSDGSSVPRVFATVMHVRRGDPTPVLQAHFAADDHARLRIPSLPDAEVITLVITAQGAAPQTISGTAAELSRTVRLLAAGRIRGKFVDEDGKALEGVRVEAEAWISSDAPAISGGRAVSDDKGRWVVDGLPRARVAMRASSKGRGTFRRELSLEQGDSDLGVIALVPSSDVTLEISDEERRPLAKAIVTTDSGFRGETNNDGTVAISDLAPDEPVAVTLRAKGFAEQTIQLTPPLPKRERVILERAFTVTGSITDDSGSPPAGVVAMVTTGPTYRRLSIDPDGTFSINIDAGKEFELTFESPSAASVSRKEEAGRPGELRNLGTIRLPSGMVVRGGVVDSTGEPVAGARVWAIRPSVAGAVASWVAGRVVQTTSDALGMFDLRGVPTGQVLLRIDVPDFARASRSVLVDDLPVDLGTITLVRGSIVNVNARTEDTAIARLDLRGEWLDADMLTAPVVAGEARLRNVPPGQYKVTVVNGRAVVCERRVEVREGADASVECPPPMMVRGRVLLDGTPAYAGSLTWSRPAETDALIDTRLSPFGARQQRVFGLGGGTAVVPVRADGTFETDQLRAGEWHVAWRSADSAVTPDRLVSIPDAAEARIVVEFAGGVIRGRVLDARNLPVAGARVREIQGPLFAMAAPDGSFTITAVPAGVHRLQAALGAKASRVLEVTVESGKHNPEVIFEIDDADRNVLSVRVIGAAGESKPNAFVFVEATGGIRILSADAHGIATGAFPEGLRDGARIVAFADNAWAFGQLRRSGGESDPQNVTIQFAETGALRIRSRTASGAPAVLSVRAGDLTWMLARVGSIMSLTPESPVIINGLPPGSYTVSLGSSATTVSVTAGSMPTAELP